ncbi:hypothetical protein Tco_0163554 [Tanacetum coccineum]
MVINSPCLIDKKELAIPGQTTTVNDGEQQLTVIVDGQTIAITEASVRRHLQFADADGISSLPNTEIFDQLTLMGYVSNDDKLNFQKGEGPTLTVEIPTHTPIAITPPNLNNPQHLNEITSLEDDLKQTKKIYGKALTKLVKKVKHLEAKLKSTTERRKARMIISDDEEDLVSEDTSKQGRITEIENEGFTLQQFTPTKVTQGEEQCQESFEAQLSVLIAAKILAIQGKEQISTDEKVAQKLDDEEMAREEQERIDFEKALELQKYYDEIRPIFEEEYNKIQTLFKKDREVEKTKTKRITEETLLQESFKKLRTSEASRSEPIQEQPTNKPKELSEEELKKMMEIVPVE